MSNSSRSDEDKAFHARAMDAAIRISLLALLVLWCFQIVKPFIMPVLWGAIMAVAIYPLFVKAYTAFGGRQKLTATLITLLALTILIVPTVMLSGSMVESSKALATDIEAGTLTVPPPSDRVKDWPLIGEKLHGAWSLASTNLEGALEKFTPQVEAIGKWFLSAAAGVGGGVLMFVVSIIIAGAFLVYGRSGSQAMETIAARVMGKKGGTEFVELAGATIRSVAQGVLGVALIQSILAGIGMLVMGVPYAGVWAGLVLLLAIIQLPPLLVLGPVVVYEFSVAETVPAVIFMIWSMIVSVSDSFLKPLFLGRGMDIPMLVILLGAIGGMILSGIIGLFVGAVVLAVGYSLFVVWLDQEQHDSEEQASAEG
ncbi:MAG TPA: AI-2E family transporter [Gammaproteobacteria bacterium]|nr:AI-2E family transporter [Gammaproteobacteria bacterium]